MSTSAPTVSETKLAKDVLENEERRITCCKLMEEFLDSLTCVFPECDLTRKQLADFRDGVINSPRLQNTFVRLYHDKMKPLYKLADAHDTKFWESCNDVPYLGAIQIAAKYKDKGLNDESRSIIWEFVDRINRQARIYNAVPVNMFTQLESAATKMATKLQNTNVAPQDWDFNELRDLGKSVVENVSQEEFSEFIDNIAGLAQNVKLDSISDVPKLVSEIPGLGDAMKQQPEIGQMMSQIFTDDNFNNLMGTMSDIMGRLGVKPQTQQP